MEQDKTRVLIVVAIKQPEWMLKRPTERFSSPEFERCRTDFASAMETMDVLYEAIKRIDPSIEVNSMVILWINTVKVDAEHVKDVLPLLQVHPLVEKADVEEGHFVIVTEKQ